MRINLILEERRLYRRKMKVVKSCLIEKIVPVRHQEYQSITD
jgi:hypothetical protein